MQPYNPAVFHYLRAIRSEGARPPLICFFPGVPGARYLAECLPPDQPVFEFYEPNMDGIAVFPTVEDLAATFMQEMRALQPSGPYQLCGYSTFGLVAYEMARMLVAEGEDVGLLALFDIWHPAFRQRLNPREYVRYRFMRLADRSRKYGRLLTRGRIGEFATTFRDFVIRRAKLIGWRLLRSMFRKRNQPVPKTMQVIESVTSHKTYNPPPYPQRLVVVRPKDLFEGLRNRTVGWDLCATAGVDVHFVKGDHGTMMKQPHVGEVGAKIAAYLAQPLTQSESPKPSLTAS